MEVKGMGAPKFWQEETRKLTVALPQHLYAELRQLATKYAIAQEHSRRSMNRLVVEAIREWLGRRNSVN